MMNKKYALGGAVAGILLFGVGSATGAAGAVKDPAPAPSPAVTVTAEPSPAVTVTADPVVSEVTPEVCLTALTMAEQAFDYAAESLGYSNDATQAAGRLDVAGLQTASANMKTVTPKLEALAPKLNAAKADCRAAAK